MCGFVGSESQRGAMSGVSSVIFDIGICESGRARSGESYMHVGTIRSTQVEMYS